MNIIVFILYFFLGNFADAAPSVDPPKERTSFVKNKLAESKKRSEIIDFAEKFQGKSYKFGESGPKRFDCSGYTSFIYHHFNIRLDRSSKMQSRQGKNKRVSQLKPADLVFFGTDGRVQHVGIIVKANKGSLEMIHCSSSRGVIVEDIYRSKYWKSKLLFGREVIKM